MNKLFTIVSVENNKNNTIPDEQQTITQDSVKSNNIYEYGIFVARWLNPTFEYYNGRRLLPTEEQSYESVFMLKKFEIVSIPTCLNVFYTVIRGNVQLISVYPAPMSKSNINIVKR